MMQQLQQRITSLQSNPPPELEGDSVATMHPAKACQLRIYRVMGFAWGRPKEKTKNDGLG